MNQEELTSGERYSKDEFEELYYGLSSTFFYETFECWLQRALKKATKEIEQSILDIPCKETEKDALHFHINNLYMSYIESSKEPLKELKEELQKVFSIPTNIVLPSTDLLNKHKNVHYSDNEIAKMKMEIEVLQEKIIKEQIFIAKLKQLKDVIDTKLKDRFTILNSAIIASKLSMPNEKLLKMLDLHEKSVKKCFGVKSENNYVKLQDNFFRKNVLIL